MCRPFRQVFVGNKVAHNASTPGLTWHSLTDPALPKGHVQEVLLGCLPSAAAGGEAVYDFCSPPLAHFAAGH